MDRIGIAVNIVVKQWMKSNLDLDVVLNNYIDPVDGDSLTEEEKAIIIPEVKILKEFKIGRHFSEIEDPALIVDPEGHEEWYREWLEENNSIDKRYHWSRLEDFLEKKLMQKMSPKLAGEIVQSIDLSSNKVIERLENPTKMAFQTKGLVIGHVQSGKTANFTAVIAKAVDAGYKFIIVLAGLHNNLRSQTQLRLDSELTGEPFSDNVEHVDIPLLAEKQWVRLSDESDFNENTTYRLESLAISGRPIIVVMKKKPQIMRKLIRWIKKAPEELRNSMPLLMIDDEADQASTNTGRNGKVTPTNTHIRAILKYFSKHAYVGYTATPFANLLIDMNIDSEKIGRDLYPRNFIVSLPRPDGYFGAEQIFSMGQEKYFVKDVNEHESDIGDLKGLPSLRKAILSYCLAAAWRYERNHKHKPMTMLIHTTHLQDGHTNLKSKIEKILDDLKDSLIDENSKDIYKEFKNMWYEDFISTTKDLYPDRLVSFDDVKPYILEFINDLDVLELNARSTDELDYTQKPDIKVIAVGGNTLSRGLTLEGLMASYFLRKSKAYDTLLQMGRWFGYREGYEDLTRIYTDAKLASYFRDLALVEKEIRDELLQYEEDEITPVNAAVKIRAHKEMKITAPNKMGAAQRIETSYSGKLAQTIWLPLNDIDILKCNIEVARNLIEKISVNNQWEKHEGNHLVRNIPVEIILQVLKEFNFTHQSGFDSQAIISYITKVSSIDSRKELLSWNVGIPGLNSPSDINKLIHFGNLNMVPVKRSKRVGQLKVGVLTTEGDLTLDLENKNDPYDRREPLLLIYRIWQGSTPERNKLKRLEPLFSDNQEKEDVIGLSIVFPKSRNLPEDYVAQIIREADYDL